MKFYRVDMEYEYAMGRVEKDPKFATLEKAEEYANGCNYYYPNAIYEVEIVVHENGKVEFIETKVKEY